MERFYTPAFLVSRDMFSIGAVCPKTFPVLFITKSMQKQTRRRLLGIVWFFTQNIRH